MIKVTRHKWSMNRRDHMRKCLVYFVIVIVDIIVITFPTTIILADSIENQEVNIQVIPD